MLRQLAGGGGWGRIGGKAVSDAAVISGLETELK